MICASLHRNCALRRHRPVCTGCTTCSTIRSQLPRSPTTPPKLLFDSTVTLEHYEAPMPEYAIEPYAATWPFSYTNEEASDLVNARSRQHPDAAVDTWARSFIARGASTSTMALLRAMTTEIKQRFIYIRRVEKGVYRPPIR